MIEKLLDTFNSYYPLSKEMTEEIIAVTSVNDYPKRTLLLKENQVANHACFVLKGLARSYYMSDGKEITTRFMDEGFMITSWLSFYTRKAGYEIIETLEDSTLACIHYKDIQALYNNFTEFNIVGRKLTEHYFYLSEQRTQLLRKHTAEEKYRFFLKQHPDLLQRTSVRHISTYLGMNEETLSRVRAKAAGK